MAVGRFLWYLHVSSHMHAEILLSCLGKRFHKFIPEEFLPFVRDTVLCVQFSLPLSLSLSLSLSLPMNSMGIAMRTASCEGVVAPGTELAVAPHCADAVQLLRDPPACGVLVAETAWRT